MRIDMAISRSLRRPIVVVLALFTLAIASDSSFGQRRQRETESKSIQERFKTMEGFKVEQVLGTEAGSIVAMTFNEDGDIIASAEGGPLRLVRLAADLARWRRNSPENPLTVPPLKRTGDTEKSPTVSDFCDQVRNCQGILCYKGYVFAVGDGPSGTAFYRLKDKNNDGAIDKENDTVETLFKFKGGMGEHGPHQPVVGPDGLIYLMVGNHAWYGGEPAKSSPHHHYYEGDLLRPRYEDANGHAVGIPAPGGQVYRMDVDAKNVELFCAGFRNAYDLAFNRDGELFTYDSDMEWDIGLPWYRPTRVNHLVAGGEYGWRSGSAKWPDYFVDSLGATIDIGRGSPTGVMFYEGGAYPRQFNDDFLIADWSRGYIIGVKLNQQGATYLGEQYIFVEGNPLNVSDLELGPDENVYFCTGGRGTQGGIFRLVYKGDHTVKADDLRSGKETATWTPESAWGRARFAESARQGDPARLVPDEASSVPSTLQKPTKQGEGGWPALMHSALVAGHMPAIARARFLALLERFSAPVASSLLVKLAQEDDPPIVAQAAYFMGLRSDDDTKAALLSLLEHADPRVQRIACESLVRRNSPAPFESLLKLLSSDDRFVAWAARRALEELPKEEWQAAVLASDHAKIFNRGSVALLILDPGRATCEAILEQSRTWLAKSIADDDRLELYRVVQLALHRGNVASEDARYLVGTLSKRFPEKDARLNREVYRLLCHLQDPSLAPRLIEQLESADVPEMEKRHLAFSGRFLDAGWTPEMRDKLLAFYAAQQQIEGQGNSFKGYWANVARDVMKNLSAEEKLARLREGATEPAQALLLVRSLSAPLSADQVGALRKLDEELQAASREGAKELARETLVALGRSGEEQVLEYLHQVFENHPDRKQDAALAVAQYAIAKERRAEDRDLLIRALPVVDGEAGRQVLQALTRFESDNVTPQMVRQVILLGLKLRRQGGQQANAVLQRWTGKELAKAGQSLDQTMAAWQAWYAEEFPDQPEAKLPEDSAANKYSLAQLMAHLTRPSAPRGDAQRGVAVFEKAQCAKCHKYGSRGEGIGPDLTNVSRRFQKREILESVLYPSQVISDQFAGKTVTTSAGLQYTGLVAEQGQNIVVLTSTGEKINLVKSDIEEIKPSKVSAMPDGLFANLSLEEISDLFAYLESETSSSTAVGWTELFNGRDLAGWVIEGTNENNKSGEAKPVWSVRDGIIHCEGAGFGFLRFDKEFCDFVLHVEYRLTKGCNSGIGIRHAKFTGKSETRPSYSGYEIQLLDDGGKQPHKGSSASLYRYVAPKSLPVKKPGEWNTIEIECRGPQIKIVLNGELVQDVNQSTVDEIKDKPLCGYVSVQNHGKMIDFRNLRLKEF